MRNKKVRDYKRHTEVVQTAEDKMREYRKYIPQFWSEVFELDYSIQCIIMESSGPLTLLLFCRI
jgi:hypothetical protein